MKIEELKTRIKIPSDYKLMVKIMSCQKCAEARISAALRSYEWTPPDFIDAPNLFFNVGEIRLFLSSLGICNIVEEVYPYSEGLFGISRAHEITEKHIDHIPVDKIRPSLIGDLVLPNRITGYMELCTLMLDGHHSALQCIKENRPVRIEIVPDWIMHRLFYKSWDEMMSSPLVILER